jgi:peptidoglycan/LPS O-acetylase OafA/YrhL
VSNATWRLEHRPALDGLRGIAILLVVGGHAHWLPGPSSRAGVNLFFALSGFLITALLLDEAERRGRVSLPAFYGRRARRLLPALTVYLCAAAAFVGVVATLPALLYAENWAMVVNGGAPGPTSIAWSLSVEEQFYLAWPLVVVAGARWGRLPWLVAVVGIVAAPVLRLLLWHGGAGWWRVYYGTGTRADVLLWGCLLALAVKRYGPSPWLRWALVPGAAAVAACCFAPQWWSVLLDPALIGVGEGAVIAATLAGAGRWLAAPVLRWFGQRSYALYLWHYVLVVEAHAGRLPMWAAVGVALLLAEGSWRLVESPFLRRRDGGPKQTIASPAGRTGDRPVLG